METASKSISKKETNVFNLLMFRFLPYWPLFALLLVIGIGFAWTYLHFATPIYEITAGILIKDENKGTNDPKIMEGLNYYSSKKIVENEIEVIRSKSLMEEVVKNLHLYAPVFEEGPIGARSAYTSSPISVELQDPDHFREQKKVYFKCSSDTNNIIIGNKNYPINQWTETPYGVVKFSSNANLNRESRAPLYFSLVTPKKVAVGLLKILNVVTVSKLGTVLTLKIKDEVPKRGEDLLNELIRVYNQASINEKNKLAANTLAFVENRIKHVAGEIDSIESRVQRFKAKKGVVDLSEQGKQYLQNVGDNDRKREDISMQLAMLSQVEKYVLSKGNNTGIVPSTLGVTDPILSQLLQKLYEAEIQYQKLKKTVTVDNPIMLSISNEIESIRPNILENIRNQRASLEASKGNLNTSHGVYTERLQSIPQKERELLEISRQRATKNEAYSFLLNKREETALSYAASVSDSRTIDKAEASIEPVSPEKLIAYLVSIVTAIALAIALICVKELLNNKILYRSEIEALTSIPIASELPEIKVYSSIVLASTKRPTIAQQFRHLRASIGLFAKNNDKKKFLVTSSIGGEGKTFISNNLALSLASSGKKVALLDMDLRNQVTSELFKLRKQKGIAQFLEDNLEPYEIIYKTDSPDLYVIPAGSPSVDPTELLLSKDVSKLIAYLEDLFDFLIIDAAPIDPVTDAYVLSTLCDVTLFVIRHNYTPKQMVQMLDHNNKIKGLKNLTIIFNAVKRRGFFVKGYGYGYGYGYENVHPDKGYNNIRVASSV